MGAQLIATASGAYRFIYRLRADGDPGAAAFKNWICTEAKADGANVAYWHVCDMPTGAADVCCSGEDRK